MKKITLTLYAVRALMLAAVILKLCMGEMGLVVYGTLAIVLTYLPELFALCFRIRLPDGLRITLTVFIFFAMTVAKLFYLYEITTWWDKLLHLGSGVILAYAGLLLAKKLTRDRGRMILLTFSLVFAIASAGVWEIWEFSGDALFGLNSQKRETGVVDTMGDIIAGTLGAAITIPFLRRAIDD